MLTVAFGLEETSECALAARLAREDACYKIDTFVYGTGIH